MIFPRARARGPIEARLGAGIGASVPYFHERALVAPLKLDGHALPLRQPDHFHERALVAPLKLRAAAHGGDRGV